VFSAGLLVPFRPAGRVALRTELSLLIMDAFDNRYEHGLLTAGLQWRIGGR
jgi:hypothetical protein